MGGAFLGSSISTETLGIASGPEGPGLRAAGLDQPFLQQQPHFLAEAFFATGFLAGAFFAALGVAMFFTSCFRTRKMLYPIRAEI